MARQKEDTRITPFPHGRISIINCKHFGGHEIVILELLEVNRWSSKDDLAEPKKEKETIISQVLPAVTHDFFFHSTDPFPFSL